MDKTTFLSSAQSLTKRKARPTSHHVHLCQSCPICLLYLVSYGTSDFFSFKKLAKVHKNDLNASV